MRVRERRRRRKRKRKEGGGGPLTIRKNGSAERGGERASDRESGIEIEGERERGREGERQKGGESERMCSR
jgi:hypothetical protein